MEEDIRIALNIAAPWGLDAVEVVELPIRHRARRGAGAVNDEADELNCRDLLMINGMYGRGAAASDVITPFSDGCGVVEAVGAGVNPL